MPNSLKAKFKKMAHDGKITKAECDELIEKLDGHDARVRAYAIKIDMDKPMHFNDEQKAWIKKYIVINAERQRADAIDECIKYLHENHYNFGKVDYIQAIEDLEMLKEKKE